MNGIRIVPFAVEHRAAWERLNRAWLVDHALLEPADEPHLTDPVGTIADEGGTIFVALLGGEVVGTAAVLPHGSGEMVLLKLTVDNRQRGHGIGRRLLEACVNEARARSSVRLVLLSNSGLRPALRLYESMGFRHRPLPDVVPYESTDVCMELMLDGPPRVDTVPSPPSEARESDAPGSDRP
jgi:putative acetyltransferase